MLPNVDVIIGISLRTLSDDLDLMSFIFDHDLQQMTLVKYKKDQTCSDWKDI